MSDSKRLYLIDAHALAYRMYFATIRTPMTNSKGQPTGAVFGFATSVLKLLQEYSCPYVAAVFDSPTPTFRHQLYPEYKANRVAMPDDMRSQIPLIHRLVDALNLPRLSREGLEADDIIAWLARKAAAEGYRVWVVSKDKDLMQLVDDRIRLLAPEPGGGLAEIGPAQVKEKLGVEPARVRDLLALMGDSSDNIPGVPGVGPKTAVALLEKAGSVANLLENPSLAGNPKLAAKIEQNRRAIEISLELATLKTDVDLGVEVESLAAQSVDKRACVELFTELEFNSLLRNPLFDTRQAVGHTVTVVSSLDELRFAVESIRTAGHMSVDTETTSMAPREAQLVGISLAVEDGHAFYVPVGHVSEPSRNLPLNDVLQVLRPVLEAEEIAKIGQNLKYDYQVFKNYGIILRNVQFDCMVAAYVLDPGRRQYGLEALASQFLQTSVTSIEALIGKKGKGQKSFAEVRVDDAAAYSGEDAVLPLRLRQVLEPLLKERQLYALFSDLEMPLVTVLAEMEWHGVKIDTSLLKELSEQYRSELETISKDIYSMAGQEFNLNSPRQIAEVFYGKLGMPRGKKTKTGLSTDVDALERLAPQYPVVRRLLDYRELQKLLSTYVDALPLEISPVTGRVHTSFNQTVTATGRLSSADPNLQNIPVRTETGARIREAFIAPEGFVLVSADYSQIELRILAHLSEDPNLLEAFRNDQDIHTRTACAIYGAAPELVTPEMRRAAKTVNFGLIYGMGAANLSRQLGISFKEAQAFIDTYFLQFPAVRAFMDRCVAEARAKGYSETLLGRRRYLPEINASERQVREAAERTAINTPVQGSAADIIKIAMVEIYREMARVFPKAAMVLQVHDELVFEVPSDKADHFRSWVADKMSSAYDLKVPLKVDVGVGKNWREAH